MCVLHLGSTATEDDVVEAILRWYKHEPKERLEDFVTIMKHVKLNHVSDSVQYQLKNDEVLSQSEGRHCYR